MSEIKKIALKAIEDDEFLAALEADPEKAAASLGITLTEEQLLKIKTGLRAGQWMRTPEGIAVSFVAVAV